MSYIDPRPISDLYEEHINHITRIYREGLRAFGYEGLIIASGQPPEVFQDDYHYPFKANHHFKHWVPVFDNPNCFVIIHADRAPELLFYTPDDFWHATSTAPSDYWCSAFKLTCIKSLDELPKLLPKKRHRYAGLIPDERTKRLMGLDYTNPRNINDYLRYHRAWKTAYEVRCTELANDIAARAHIAAEQCFQQGGTEHDIHLAYLKSSKAKETEMPYENIIGINEHAAILHYNLYDAVKPEKTHSLLIDAGAWYQGYAADITRTYSQSDNLTYNQLLEAMETLMLNIVDEVKPGASLNDCQRLTHRKVAGLLSEVGLVDMSVEEMVQKKVTGAFYPHGLGHYLGLQVHDVGGTLANPYGDELPRPEDYPNLRYLRPLEADNIITIEPGLYFIEMLLNELKAKPEGKQVNWSLVEELMPCGGIRIEDDILVIESGHRNLSREAFERVSMV